MSTDYTETLKKIKETEEATSREILERRKQLEEELRKLEEESAADICRGEAAGRVPRRQGGREGPQGSPGEG